MVNATFKEHVAPEEKRATTGLTVNKIRPNCCGVRSLLSRATSKRAC
jgi:hypothetical protein